MGRRRRRRRGEGQCPEVILYIDLAHYPSS
jgi:hypothetical protein